MKDTELVPEAAPATLVLRLEVSDPDVVVELRRHAEGEERQRFALAALRLGVLSLHLASGQLDSGAVQEAGSKLMADLRELLSTRAVEMTQQIASELKQYFDPRSGLVPQRIEALVQKDGQLERMLLSHLGPDESVLARTLAAHLGEGSAVLKMLSPTEANGLLSQIAATLETALTEQRERVVKEFSLDIKDSALSRLVAEITTRQGELGTGLKEQIDGIVKEFSLDQPDSALSRLVSRVEAAQKSITDEFSTDNEESALNRLSHLLQDTSDEIGKNLTLDDDTSALSRLKRELQTSLDGLVTKNAEFHAEVRETLAKLQTRKEEAARSTRHGVAFEVQLGDVLASEAQRMGDIHQATGNRTGSIKNCKVGDHVVECGPESPTPGVRIVWEAKEHKGYDLRKALKEMEKARKNRSAQVGVFVFSKKTAPANLQPLTRYGADIVIEWDAEDATTDIYVKAAFSVGRALAIREAHESQETEGAVQGIEAAARAVEKQISHLEEFKQMGDTVKAHGEKIADRAARMKKGLTKEVGKLDKQIAALKTARA